MPASTTSHDTAASSHPRYRYIGDSMRVVARREPTLALDVHVGIARRQAAIRVMNGLRVHPAAATRAVGKQIAAGLARAYCEDLRSRWTVATSRLHGRFTRPAGSSAAAAGEPKWTRYRFLCHLGDDGAAPVMSSWGS
jgi:hypothetical protein